MILWRFLCSVCVVFSVLNSAFADPLATVRGELDLQNTRVTVGKASGPIERFNLQTLLGYNKATFRWTSPAPKADQKSPPRVFVIAFTKPTAVGSVFWEGSPTELRVLKADATAIDPNNAKSWETIPVPRSQGGGLLAPCPTGLKTRAIALVDSRDSGQADLFAVRILQERLLNATPWSLAYADREFTPPNTTFIPNPASLIPAGTGSWVNVGKNGNGFVAAPPVSDLNPSWFMLTWNEPRQLTGLWLQSNAAKLELEFFHGADTVHPRAGVKSEWRKLRDFDDGIQRSHLDENVRWLSFPPVATRGVRVRFTKTNSGPIAIVRALHALHVLDKQPVPSAPASQQGDSAVSLEFETAAPRRATFVINDTTGKRMRNAFARSALPAGKQIVGWDLKDENGAFVSPGKYQWTALTWPELQLKYEMTAYPNVAQHAPENAPWLTGTDGRGGWMADHSPPCSTCVAGDKVFLGSYVAESGVSLIECDLDGRKTWGHHSFAAWTGARFLAFDGRQLYVAAPILGTSNESVWVIDPTTHAVKNLLSLTPTASRRRGMQGIAARDGKLYMSVKAAESWLTNAASGDDVDLQLSRPLKAPKRKPRVAYEVVPDPQGDFVRLFRLAGTPPGGATGFTATHLETQRGSASKQHIVLAFKRPVPLGSVVFPRPVFKDMKDMKFTLSVLKADVTGAPNADNAQQWQSFATMGDQAWDCVAAPENTLTRALRLTFSRGGESEDDLLANAVESKDKPKGDLDLDLPEPGQKSEAEKLLGDNDSSAWKGQIEGMKLLRRRLVNVAGSATVQVNSGKLAADGAWDAQRSEPLTESNPAVYGLTWEEAQKLRGLAIKEIDGALTRIDVFTGQGEVDFQSNAGWEQVSEYRQQRRDLHSGFESCNSTARYMDGYVDFGREVTTRAVRLRVVAQWTDNGERGSDGQRNDLGAGTIDATRCRVWGVAALQYLGGEPPVDSAASERLEVYDTRKGQLISEIALPSPGEVACNQAGDVFALSGKQIVRVDVTADKYEPFITDLLEPTDFAFDSAGNCYAFDNAVERHHVRVYDAQGQLTRTIGTDGGFQVGKWDATRLGDVVSLDVDARGQIWCVEGQYHPKRVTVWTTAGKFVKELLGNTPYGGGGVLDPNDKRRVFYGPLEF